MIQIASNVLAQKVIRTLDSATAVQSAVYERLSSGQRINRASDDAAGLSVVSSLNVRQRVYNQGVRNLNDGISSLQIASDTVDQLSQITTRLTELAQQASNGTLEAAQRKSLDQEAQQLSQEYNRLVSSTSYNGLRLFGGTSSTLNIQAGFGNTGVLSTNVGGARSSGSFTNTSSSQGTGNSVRTADLNGDGNLDLVSAAAGNITIQYGNGDGTFRAGSSISTPNGTTSLAVGDINGDGTIDIVANTGVDIQIFTAARDGSLTLSKTFNANIHFGIDIIH